MDVVTAAGLAIGIIPLTISALENYEYTFQSIIIFSRRYKKEVKQFQQALSIQAEILASECCLLLHCVTDNQGEDST